MRHKIGKNIIICFDGTGNQFKEENSNVVKLYRALKRDPQVQVAYYDPGVGTLADPQYRTPVAKKLQQGLWPCIRPRSDEKPRTGLLLFDGTV